MSNKLEEHLNNNEPHWYDMGIKKNAHIGLFAFALILSGFSFIKGYDMIGGGLLVFAFLLVIFRNQFYDLIS